MGCLACGGPHPPGACVDSSRTSWSSGSLMGGFTSRFDDLHVHKYPELHGGSNLGASLHQTDLLTGKKSVIGSYELNIFPKSLQSLLKK